MFISSLWLTWLRPISPFEFSLNSIAAAVEVCALTNECQTQSQIKVTLAEVQSSEMLVYDFVRICLFDKWKIEMKREKKRVTKI